MKILNKFIKLIYIYTLVVLYITSCHKDDDGILMIEEPMLENKHIPYGFYVQINENDDVLDIKWNVTNDIIKKVVISATSENGEIGMFSEPYATDVLEDSIKFSGGTHGKLYKFVIHTFDANSNMYWSDSIENLFIEHSKIPNLPLMKIWTDNWKMPSCTYVTAPNGYWGKTIKNNAYVNAIMNDSIFGKIKIRGNTSAYSKNKKPYKINLKNEIDLLHRNNFQKYKSKEWILLPCTENLNFVVGQYVSEICRNEWQPQYTFANIILNGKWLGLYSITESISSGNIDEEHSSQEIKYWKMNVSPTGYIIEDDAYWWNESIYFKTPLQIEQSGFTFKYPDSKQCIVFDNTVANIKNYISIAENKILHNEEYQEYIDLNSYVNWLLVHSILGISDAYGSNIFYYKYDYIDSLPTSSKLKMGPCWDFDSNYMFKTGLACMFSYYPFNYLSKDRKTNGFIDTYKKNWNTVKKYIGTDFSNQIYDKIQSQELDIDESRKLEANCYSSQYKTIQEDLYIINNWFQTRIPYLDKSINELQIDN